MKGNTKFSISRYKNFVSYHDMKFSITIHDILSYNYCTSLVSTNTTVLAIVCNLLKYNRISKLVFQNLGARIDLGGVNTPHDST